MVVDVNGDNPIEVNLPTDLFDDDYWGNLSSAGATDTEGDEDYWQMLFGWEDDFMVGYTFGDDASYNLMTGWDNAPTIANVEATGWGSAKVRTTYTVEHSLGGPPWTKEIELEQGITVTELPPEVRIVGAPREAIQARMKVRLFALHAPWKEDLQFTWSSRAGDDGGQVAVHNSGRIIAIHPGAAWVKAEAKTLVNGRQQTVSAEVEIKIEEPDLGIYTSSTFLLLGEFATLSANTSHHGGEWVEWNILKIDGLNDPAALHVIQDESDAASAPPWDFATETTPMDVAFGAMPMQDMAQQQAQLVAEEWGYVVVQATYRVEHPDDPTIFWEKTVTSETIQLYESPPAIQINGQNLPWEIYPGTQAGIQGEITPWREEVTFDWEVIPDPQNPGWIEISESGAFTAYKAGQVTVVLRALVNPNGEPTVLETSTTIAVVDPSTSVSASTYDIRLVATPSTLAAGGYAIVSGLVHPGPGLTYQFDYEILQGEPEVEIVEVLVAHGFDTPSLDSLQLVLQQEQQQQGQTGGMGESIHLQFLQNFQQSLSMTMQMTDAEPAVVYAVLRAHGWGKIRPNFRYQFEHPEQDKSYVTTVRMGQDINIVQTAPQPAFGSDRPGQGGSGPDVNANPDPIPGANGAVPPGPGGDASAAMTPTIVLSGDVSLHPGEATQLRVIPAELTYTWSSVKGGENAGANNIGYVDVDQTGNVTAYQPGKSTVHVRTIVSVNGERTEIKGELEITVSKPAFEICVRNEYNLYEGNDFDVLVTATPGYGEFRNWRILSGRAKIEEQTSDPGTFTCDASHGFGAVGSGGSATSSEENQVDYRATITTLRPGTAAIAVDYAVDHSDPSRSYLATEVRVVSVIPIHSYIYGDGYIDKAPRVEYEFDEDGNIDEKETPSIGHMYVWAGPKVGFNDRDVPDPYSTGTEYEKTSVTADPLAGWIVNGKRYDDGDSWSGAPISKPTLDAEESYTDTYSIAQSLTYTFKPLRCGFVVVRALFKSGTVTRASENNHDILIYDSETDSPEGGGGFGEIDDGDEPEVEPPFSLKVALKRVEYDDENYTDNGGGDDVTEDVCSNKVVVVKGATITFKALVGDLTNLCNPGGTRGEGEEPGSTDGQGMQYLWGSAPPPPFVEWQDEDGDTETDPAVVQILGQSTEREMKMRFNRQGTFRISCRVHDGSCSSAARMASNSYTIIVSSMDLSSDAVADNLETDAPGLIVHINSDNDDLIEELKRAGAAADENTPQIDKDITWVDGANDIKDMREIYVRLDVNNLSKGLVTLAKTSGSGEVRVFLKEKSTTGFGAATSTTTAPATSTSSDEPDDGYKLICGPGAEADIDLWQDLVDNNGKLTLWVEGHTLKNVTLTLSHKTEAETHTDEILITVVDIQGPDTIYQLEVLEKEFVVEGGTANTILDEMVFGIPNGDEGLAVLKTDTNDLTFATPEGVHEDTTLYAFDTSGSNKQFKAFGSANEFNFVSLVYYQKTVKGYARVWDDGILAVPLSMSQRVLPPGYGFGGGNGNMAYADQAQTQALGLLGNEGVLEAKTDNNYDMTGRDIEFTRDRLNWTYTNLTEPTFHSVFMKQRTVSGANYGGESISGNKAAVKIYGARPGFAKIRVDLAGMELGSWDVQVHTPVVKKPHPGQMNLDATADANAPIDGMKISLEATHSNMNASSSVHMAEAQIQRARLFLMQLLDPTKGLQDNTVFSWALSQEFGFTLQQARSLINGSNTALPTHHQLNLIKRITQYSMEASNGNDASGQDRGNGDMYEFFKNLARQEADTACLARLIQGVSIEVNPQDYLAHANSRGSVMASDPRNNHYKSNWPATSWTSLGTQQELVALFSNTGANSWSVQHPYTVTALKAMIAQRQDLARGVSASVGEKYETSQYQRMRDNAPLMLFQPTAIKVKLKYTDYPWVGIHIKDDLSWVTAWVKEKQSRSIPGPYGVPQVTWSETGNYIRFRGDDFFKPELARQERYNTDTHGIEPNATALASSSKWFVDVDYDGPSKYSDSTRLDEDVFYECYREMDMLRDVIDNMADIIGWEIYRNAYGNVGVCFLWIGTTVGPVGDMYEAWSGNGFLDDRELGLGERFLAATFAAMDVVPFAVGVSKAVTPVMRGMAGSLAKKTVGTALRGVAGAENVVKFARKLNSAADFDVGSYASNALRNTTSKVFKKAAHLTGKYADDIDEFSDAAEIALELRLLKGKQISLGDVKVVAHADGTAKAPLVGIDITKQGNHLQRRLKGVTGADGTTRSIDIRERARRITGEVSDTPSTSIDAVEDLLTVRDEFPSDEVVRRFSGPSQASQYLDDAQGNLDAFVYRPTSTGAKHLPAGDGATNKWGDVWYSTNGSMTDQLLVRNHEYVHSFLSPKIKLFRELRADISMALYQRSPLLRCMEEALAETVAQLSVRGISIETLMEGLLFPVRKGKYFIWARDARPLLRDSLIGTVTIGGVSYSVYAVSKDE